MLDGSCDLAHTIVGTPYYMSPELFANQPYNHKSDIWALGCCVHEIASLKHAFSARSFNALMYKVIKGRIPPIPLQYSSDLVELVNQMLAVNAEERPSVHQILRMAFVRKHIKMFLGRAACRKRCRLTSDCTLNHAIIISCRRGRAASVTTSQQQKADEAENPHVVQEVMVCSRSVVMTVELIE